MSDNLWSFPRTGLARALEGLAALRDGLGLPPDAQPGNALGDPRDANGEIVVPQAGAIDDPPPVPPAWIGRPGSAASSYQDMSGATVAIPAKGDPDRYYMHMRTDIDAPGFDPADYGFEPTDPAESAAVLGVWAGDEVPTGAKTG